MKKSIDLKPKAAFDQEDGFEFDPVDMLGYQEYKMLRRLKGETEADLIQIEAEAND